MNEVPPTETAKSGDKSKGQPGSFVVMATLGTPAVVGIVVYAAAEGSWSIFALSSLIAACAFALGALLGFLFGIPQYFAGVVDAHAAKNRATYQPNTNLTQVSDWLTKIIIGIGLVQFGQLVDAIGRLGDSLEPSLGGSSTGKAFGIALVVGFFVIGFLVGYLYTRLRLQWAFAAADRGAFENAVEDVAEDVAEKKIERQKEADLQLFKLLDRKTEKPSAEKVKAVIAEASPAAKEQVKMKAEAEKSSVQVPSERAEAVLEAIDEADREQP
jgi:uncharacterized membrane protein YciS (DUF1049 family)